MGAISVICWSADFQRNGKLTLDYLGRPNVTARVLKMEKREVKRKPEIRGEAWTQPSFDDEEMGSGPRTWTKLKAGKGKENGFFLKLQEGKGEQPTS